MKCNCCGKTMEYLCCDSDYGWDRRPSIEIEEYKCYKCGITGYYTRKLTYDIKGFIEKVVEKESYRKTEED